jgi:hypothetical protein
VSSKKDLLEYLRTFAKINGEKSEEKAFSASYIPESSSSSSSTLNTFVGNPSDKRRRLILLFSGQGPQWYGMGRVLYMTNKVFFFCFCLFLFYVYLFLFNLDFS